MESGDMNLHIQDTENNKRQKKYNIKKGVVRKPPPPSVKTL